MTDENLILEAAATGNTVAMKQLIQGGADINTQHPLNKWTALHWACHRNHIDIVRLLLENGAQKDLQESCGKTPLQLTKNPSIAQLLGSSVSGGPISNMEDVFAPNYIRNPLITPELMKLSSGVPSSVPITETTPSAEPVQVQSSQVKTQSTDKTQTQSVQDKKEFVVYKDKYDADCVIGAINITTSSHGSHLKRRIQEELDDVPDNFRIYKVKNDGLLIPITEKQLNLTLSHLFVDCLQVVIKQI